MTTDTSDTRTYVGSLRPGAVIRWRDRRGEHTDEVVHAQRYGADCVMIATRTGRTLHWGATDTVEALSAAAAAAEWRDEQAHREQRARTAALLRKIADTIEELGERELAMVTIHVHYANEDTWRRAVEELDARELPPDAGEWRAAVGEPWDTTLVYLHAQRVEGQ